MSLSCLIDKIGINGKCEADANAELFLNALPGITLKSIDAGISEEHSSALSLMREKIATAARLVKADFPGYLRQKIVVKNLVEEATAGFWAEDKEDVAAEAKYKGINIRLDGHGYTELYISTISLFTNHTGAIAVKIIDLIHGKVLDTVNVAAVAGEAVTVNVGKAYGTSRQRLNLLVAYDATAVIGYKSTVYNPYDGRYTVHPNCKGCSNAYPYVNNYAILRAASLPLSGAMVNANLTGIDSTAGLSLDYGLRCSIDMILCKLSDVLLPAVWYKAGALLMSEMKHSKRLSSAVLLHKDSHDELMMEFEGRYAEAMRSAAASFSLPNDICFRCNSSIQTIVRLP